MHGVEIEAAFLEVLLCHFDAHAVGARNHTIGIVFAADTCRFLDEFGGENALVKGEPKCYADVVSVADHGAAQDLKACVDDLLILHIRPPESWFF